MLRGSRRLLPFGGSQSRPHSNGRTTRSFDTDARRRSQAWKNGASISSTARRSARVRVARTGRHDRASAKARRATAARCAGHHRRAAARHQPGAAARHSAAAVARTSRASTRHSRTEIGLERARTVSSSAVPPRRPTSCAPIGSPSGVLPHGIVMAGWPVTLKSCVSRSVTLRTGSSDPPTRTVDDADLVRRDRQRRQQQRRRSPPARHRPRASAPRARAAPARSLRPGCSGPSRAAAARSACSRRRGSRASSRDTPAASDSTMCT